MPGEDPRGRQTLGLGGPQIVGIDDLQHGAAHQAGKVGHGPEAQHQRRDQHVRDRAPARHRQQGKPEDVVQLHKRQLPQGGEHETWHRNAKNDEEHDQDVGQFVAIERGQRAPQDAAERCKDDGQDSERCRDREVLPDDVVHLPVLLGERNPEVTSGQVSQVDDVLLGQRLIQPVLGLEILADFRGYGPVAAHRIARHRMHGQERRRGDEPHRYNALDQPLDGVSPHAPVYFSTMLTLV